MMLSTLLLATTLTLWHAMQGAEKAALEETVARANRDAAGRYEVALLEIPFDAFARKLETTVPRGHGPDLFVAAHDRLGDWVREGLCAPVGPLEGAAPGSPAADETLRAGVAVSGTAYAIPVSYKALLLYYDSRILNSGPPRHVHEVPGLARRLAASRPGTFALAYDATNFFYHAPFFFSEGGRLFDGDRIAVFDVPRPFAMPLALLKAGAIPTEASTELTKELFNSGRAAIVLSGPWFAGDITRPRAEWGVAPLFEGEGSLVSVEGVFVAATSPEVALAREAAAALAARWVAPPGAAELEAAMRPSLARSVVTPSRPEMALVWDPAKDLLRDILERGLPLDEALARARHALEVTSRPDPPRVDPGPYETAASGLLVLLALYACVRAVRTDAFRRALRPEARFGYKLALPGVLSMLALVVLPFVAGALISLTCSRGEELSVDEFRRTFVGLENFRAILSTRDFPVTEPGSFWFTLAVTSLWTIANVALHVTLGVALALLLRRPWLALRGVYRVLLVVPWAVPSYITALIWKGMFNRQFGAINAILVALHLAPVSWFSRFATAFFADVCTNTWLGFPFMLVVTLGALQGIPPELEEVAALEGASRRQRLRMVVLPAIRPALLPAVVLGSVWTFNMFNVIYLVSGGEPAGSTEILISEAYKWAFVRQHRYGYASAYAVLIFAILLLGARLAPASGGKERAAA